MKGRDLDFVIYPEKMWVPLANNGTAINFPVGKSKPMLATAVYSQLASPTLFLPVGMRSACSASHLALDAKKLKFLPITSEADISKLNT